MARRRRSKYSAAGQAALDEIEAYQRSWVIIPTAEHYKDGELVVIRAPRFQNPLGKGLVNILRRDPEFNLHLDEFGSDAWLLFDGRRTLGEVADHMAKRAGDEPRIALTRLIMFLRGLKTAGVVRVVTLERAETTEA
ncbi:MAG: PqqD family peptide modification chaperone [Thermoplasmata archaeon]|nr:PqqD family protein [Thermoplasmata archaeon]NIS11772.1 PqqD family protein [Thermoplasmata archaeon]NIS19663.1 PqqD family protein [Thermoplasmata archaeon]NIT76838.1 PqqD family protein [Thermoplasmata archaeon]NIU48773.1 PqqD family protein [Thermoplasmata archaeon]